MKQGDKAFCFQVPDREMEMHLPSLSTDVATLYQQLPFILCGSDSVPYHLLNSMSYRHLSLIPAICQEFKAMEVQRLPSSASDKVEVFFPPQFQLLQQFKDVLYKRVRDTVYMLIRRDKAN